MSKGPEFYKEKWYERPCFFMEGKLQDEVDGKNGFWAKIWVRSHLFYCFRCRGFFKDIGKLKSRLFKQKEQETSPDALEALKQRIQAELHHDREDNKPESH